MALHRSVAFLVPHPVESITVPVRRRVLCLFSFCVPGVVQPLPEEDLDFLDIAFELDLPLRFLQFTAVRLTAEPKTTHFGALVRLLFHGLLGLQLRRLLRWSSIGAREGFYLLCSLLLEPWIKFSLFLRIFEKPISLTLDYETGKVRKQTTRTC